VSGLVIIDKGCIMRNSIDWSEFLKNRDGKESSDRLLLLASFPFATGPTLGMGTTEALVVYSAAYGVLAANNKWLDRNANIPVGNQELEANTDSDTSAGSGTARVPPSQPSVRKRKTRPF